MAFAAAPDGDPRSGVAVFAAVFAAGLAGLGWTALAIDFSRVLLRSLDVGRGLPETVFDYIRYFTILTNCGVAALMTVAAIAIWRSRRAPSAAVFRAALVYMVVTCVTYEALLRRLWSPQGVQFATDLVFHDVQPALTLLFWLVCAPKRDLRWRGIPWILVYPAIYFAVILVTGALGAGYPYGFLDAGRLGYPAVLVVGAVFLAVFLALGILATATARVLTGGRS